MALDRYGVLAARALATRREDATETPHLQVHLLGAAGEHWRAAVNVESRQAPSELLYLVDEDFRHPLTAALAELPPGWHPPAPGTGGPQLDYIRGNLFERTRMRLLPPALEGPDNDLADLIDHWLGRAVSDPQATVFAFGQRFGPEADIADTVFGFTPANGVHDVHMNQGNAAPFDADNGVRQDGALVLRFAAQSRWVAIFLAFQGQAFHTDDTTGDPLGEGGGAGAEPPPVRVRIVAAMVNPPGPAPEAESVLLLNASPEPVDLTGWRLADRGGQTCDVPGGRLGAGDTRRVAISGHVTLGNGGATITLLDAAGLKAHGVAYTAADAGREGWTVTF
ncbi:MAG: hypothetical protein QOG42_678 [Solirubrobacteraceae bacterium]|nr:hypothetical protein [Solirubrobacteraceae bacterium]